MGKQGKTKSWSQPQWRLWQGARRHQAGWQDGWPSGDSAGYQQAQGYEPYVTYAADKTQNTGFPAYDLARPGQHITVIQESRSQAGQAGYSLVQEVQAAVNQARKTETKLIRLQREKTKKEQMWVQYAKDMQAAFTKERARHIANINKLQQDIQDTQALVVEDQQRVQNAAAGCFRGMAGSTEAQQEWDTLISENQQGPDDAPMSNKDLYSMLVRCAQAASASVAAGTEPPSTGPLRDGTNAPVAARPDLSAAPCPAMVPPKAPPVPGMAPAPGYMPASPGPALRDPYLMSPGTASNMAGAASGVPSPHVQRHPPPSGSRPRAPVKQVVSGVVKTISPGRQLADKLEQRRRALVPFGGANPGPRMPTPMETTDSHNVTARLEPTLPEAYDLDLDPDPDLVPGGLEDLG
eukprot:s456_g17.t1